MFKFFFEALLILVLYFQMSGLDLQTISHDLIMEKKLTLNSPMSLLKLKIAPEGSFGLENHGSDFFLKNFTFSNK